MPKKSSSIVRSTVYLIVTGVLVGVLTQWANNNIWQSEVSVQELLDRSPISLARWQAMAVELNMAPPQVRERVFNEYRGEQVTWAGYFDQFNDQSAQGSSAQHAISLILYDSQQSLNSDTILGPPFVRCFFPSSSLESVSKLRRGQKIVVRGTLATPDLMGTVLATDLSQCELVAFEDEQHQMAMLPDVVVR